MADNLSSYVQNSRTKGPVWSVFGQPINNFDGTAMGVKSANESAGSILTAGFFSFFLLRVFWLFRKINDFGRERMLRPRASNACSVQCARKFTQRFGFVAHFIGANERSECTRSGPFHSAKPLRVGTKAALSQFVNESEPPNCNMTLPQHVRISCNPEGM